jgi:hypothetical protein
MRHTHTGPRSTGAGAEGCSDVRATLRPSERGSPRRHTLCDESGKPIGEIMSTPAQPEFGRLEPTLLLRRDDVLPIRDGRTDRGRPAPETEEYIP